jgi:predicted nuclease of predicted toxin-antitoxin system
MTGLYSNENFPIDAVIFLKKLGYDVLTSYEAGQANQGIPDDEVLAYATEQNRAVITLNRKDFIQIHRSGVTHCGIIICKDDRDYSGQVNVLHHYLQFQANLHNHLIRVQKHNQQKSSQQIFVVQDYDR